MYRVITKIKYKGNLQSSELFFSPFRHSSTTCSLAWVRTCLRSFWSSHCGLQHYPLNASPVRCSTPSHSFNSSILLIYSTIQILDGPRAIRKVQAVVSLTLLNSDRCFECLLQSAIDFLSRINQSSIRIKYIEKFSFVS